MWVLLFGRLLISGISALVPWCERAFGEKIDAYGGPSHWLGWFDKGVRPGPAERVWLTRTNALAGGSVEMTLDRAGCGPACLVVCWESQPEQFMLLLEVALCESENLWPWAGQRAVDDYRLEGVGYVIRCEGSHGTVRLPIISTLQDTTGNSVDCCLATAVASLTLYACDHPPPTGTKSDAGPGDLVFALELSPAMLEQAGVLYALEVNHERNHLEFGTHVNRLEISGARGLDTYFLTPAVEHPNQWARVRLTPGTR